MRYVRKALLLALTSCSTAFAQTPQFNGPGFTIGDNSQTTANCSAVQVSGFTGPGRIWLVEYDDVLHARVGDLVFGLFPPGFGPPDPTGFVTMSSPPVDRACGLAGSFQFNDGAGTTLDQYTAGCTPGQFKAGGGFHPSVSGGALTSFSMI